MGIPKLTHNLQGCGGRISLMALYEKDSSCRESKIASGIACNGKINSIGIDGAIFLHGHTNCEDSIYDNTTKISSVILHYVKSICNFFAHYGRNNGEEGRKENVKVLFTIDGPPPVKKNRKERDDNKDKKLGYGNMSFDEKRQLHLSVIERLKMILHHDRYDFELQSNHDIEEREEGEIELIKHAKEQGKETINVILSSDSDVTAMVILNKMINVVIVTPTCRNDCPYISNLKSISIGLGMSYNQLLHYVILHFIFFGSDYNYGLMNCPTSSKKALLYEESLNESFDIDRIGRRCTRTKVINSVVNYDNEEIKFLKKLLIIEGLCSILYYSSMGKMKHLLTENVSPLIYLNHDKMMGNDLNIRTLVALINF